MTDWGWGKVEGEERRGDHRRRIEKKIGEKGQERGGGQGRQGLEEGKTGRGWRRGRNRLTY